MVGHIVLINEKGRRPRVERESVRGLGLLRAAVPVPEGTRERKAEKRVRQTARLLCGSGVRRVLAAPGFPWWPVLEEEGLQPVDPAAFLQSMAAPLALAALERRGTPPRLAVVLLRGRRVSRPLFQAAAELCPQVRGLAVDAGEDGAALSQWLRQEYGAPVLEAGDALAVDVAVDFTPGTGWGAGTVLDLSGPEPGLCGLTIRAEGDALPEELDRLPLLALLWEEQRVSRSELSVITNKST